MKKALLISVGVIILMLVLGIWAYLIFFGTPDSPQQVFSNFGFDIIAQPTTPVAEPEAPAPEPEIVEITDSNSALQQLTTRAVAGFIVLEDGNQSRVRFAEVGTGHIYDLILATRTETRMSGTTIPQVTDAVFSPDGQRVALTQIAGGSSETFVGELTGNGDEATLEGEYLLPNARDIFFTPDAVLYTTADFSGTRGWRYAGSLGDQTTLFELPFSAVRMIWQANGPHYFYNRPATQLAGTLFVLDGSHFEPVAPDKFGRAAVMTESYYALTFAADNQLLAESTDRKTGEARPLAIATIPEKCTADQIDSQTLWCAAPIAVPPAAALDEWYQGVATSDDALWELQLSNGEATLEADFETLSGRPLDATGLTSDAATNQLVFINKLDRTLWLYDLLAQ